MLFRSSRAAIRRREETEMAAKKTAKKTKSTKSSARTVKAQGKRTIKCGMEGCGVAGHNAKGHAAWAARSKK